MIKKKGYATLSEIAEDICKKKGLELETSSFLNSNKKIYVYDNEVKAREYMSYISEKAGGFCCAGRTGKIQIKKLGEDEEIIPQRLFKTYKWGEGHQISRVAYENGTESFKVGDETKDTLWIRQENLFISEEDDIQKIYDAVKDLDFYSFEGTTIINPAVDIGDIINIDGKKVIYQGEMTLNKRFIADIKSKIAIKQKQDTTTRKQSQQVINRKIQSQIDEENLKLTQLAKETTENTEKLTKHEQTIESISDKVSHIEETTNVIEGNKTISLGNAVAGELIELHIYGNNDVFSSLKISDDVVLSDDLYLLGDSLIVITDSKGNSKDYELGIEDVLRQKDDVYDEYVFKDGKAQIIRRINSDGTIKVKETIEDLGAFSIELFDGTNTLSIKNYTASLKAKFAIQNDMTNIYASKVEMTAEIATKANEINQKVEQKVDAKTITGAYLILKINDDESIAKLKADKIELSANDILNLLAGKEINLSSKKITFKSDDFSVDTNGKISATGGTIGGFELASESFTGKLDGIYDYNEYDSRACLLMAVDVFSQTSELIGIYDLNGDGLIDGRDSLRILSILEGKLENTKVLRGELKINAKDPKNAISISKDGVAYVSIGLGGINSNMINCKNFICSTRENLGTTINGETGTIISKNSAGNKIVLDPDGITTPKLTQTSLAEQKKNFEKMQDGAVDVLKNIDIYKYNLKCEKDTDKKHIGFVIGDKYNYSKEVTSLDNKGVDNYSFTSLCCKAIQELSQQVESLQNEIKILKEDKQ